VTGHGELPLLFLVVEDLQENQPDHLADALSVTIDANILAHDVLYGFDQGGERHSCYSYWFTRRHEDTKSCLPLTMRLQPSLNVAAPKLMRRPSGRFNRRR